MNNETKLTSLTNSSFNNNNISKLDLNKLEYNIQKKHDIPASQEWINSGYLYNKANEKLLPVADDILNNLIKSYFNFNILENSKKSKRIEIRYKRLSINKILVSKAEVNHTNNKATVTIYIYNRNKIYLQKQERKLNNIFSYKNSNYIKYKSLHIVRKARKHRLLFLKALKWDTDNFESFEASYYVNYIQKVYKKRILYSIYTRWLLLNNNKFNDWFLIGLKSLLSKVYNKNVDLNIVNLKYLHYNKDNFIESISTKLKNRKNGLLKVLKKAINLAKIPSIDLRKTENNIENYSNMSIVSPENVIHINDYTIFGNNLDKWILETTKYKTVNGVRIDASGRLSKRLTASRSVFKSKYKGSLKDIDSSHKGLSSVLYRGHMKPNIQQTNLGSKTRNGAFGLKGWISSY